MKQFIKKVLCRSTVYFTVFTLIFSILVLIGNSSDDRILMEPTRILCIYPFCLFFAIANTTVTYKKIDAAIRWILHAAVTVCGAFVFLILPADLESSSGNFMGFALITFVYFVGVLLYALINKRVRSAIAEDRELSGKKKIK